MYPYGRFIDTRFCASTDEWSYASDTPIHMLGWITQSASTNGLEYHTLAEQFQHVDPTPIVCEYCGSRVTDWRGNCGACGAPKGSVK